MLHWNQASVRSALLKTKLFLWFLKWTLYFALAAICVFLNDPIMHKSLACGPFSTSSQEWFENTTENFCTRGLQVPSSSSLKTQPSGDNVLTHVAVLSLSLPFPLSLSEIFTGDRELHSLSPGPHSSLALHLLGHCSFLSIPPRHTYLLEDVCSHHHCSLCSLQWEGSTQSPEGLFCFYT